LNNEKLNEFNRFMLTNRPGWKFMLEGEKIRILTSQWIVDFIFVDELLKKHGMVLHDIMTHQQYGVCLNVLASEIKQ